MKPQLNALQTGAFLAALAVGLGAFAAHGLKNHLDAYSLDVFEKGVRYQMYAALALMALGSQPNTPHRSGRPALLLLLGVLIFSFSLYLLALTGVKVLGAITPIGGVLMIAGLVLAGVEAGKRG